MILGQRFLLAFIITIATYYFGRDTVTNSDGRMAIDAIADTNNQHNETREAAEQKEEHPSNIKYSVPREPQGTLQKADRNIEEKELAKMQNMPSREKEQGEPSGEPITVETSLQIHVVQVDTRDPNTNCSDQAEHCFATRYTQHVCALKGWKYTFVNASQLCPNQKGKKCGVSMKTRDLVWSPTWLKVLALWYLLETDVNKAPSSTEADTHSSLGLSAGPQLVTKEHTLAMRKSRRTLFVFIDSDAILTNASEFVPSAFNDGANTVPPAVTARLQTDKQTNGTPWVAPHMWVGRDSQYYGSLCGRIDRPEAWMSSLPYHTCINTGLMAMHSTPEVRLLLRRWWDSRWWKGTTPWMSFNVARGALRSVRLQWPWEQDAMSIIMTNPPFPITRFVHTANRKKEPNDNFPISRVYHTVELGGKKKYADLLRLSRLRGGRTSETVFEQEGIAPISTENTLSLSPEMVRDVLGVADMNAKPVECHTYKVLHNISLNTCEKWPLPSVEWDKWSAVRAAPSTLPEPQTSSEVIGDNDTCYGKSMGLYTIAGIENVLCEDGNALIQVSVSKNYGWSWAVTKEKYIQSANISADRPGWRSAANVSVLARFSSHVVLVDVNRGSVRSTENGLAVAALRSPDGTWHAEAPLFETGSVDGANRTKGWCFPDSCWGRSSMAKGWPNMFESCGSDKCVHWLAGRQHGKFKGGAAQGSATWLVMRPSTQSERAR